MTVLTRDSVLLTKNYSRIHLGTLLDNYGAELVSKMIPSVYIFYHEQNRFQPYRNSKVCNAMTRNIYNGRPLHHINKNTGYLKSKYKKSLQNILKQELALIEYGLPHPRFTKSVHCIQRFIKQKYSIKNHSAIIIQKYIRRYLVKIAKSKAIKMINENVDFVNDCITTEVLTDPCIILPDFRNGNFVIYNKSTIQKMEIVEKVPLFSYFNEISNSEEIIYRYDIVKYDVFHNKLYKSPFTRTEFTRHEVMDLNNNLIYKFGNAITVSQNRIYCDNII